MRSKLVGSDPGCFRGSDHDPSVGSGPGSDFYFRRSGFDPGEVHPGPKTCRKLSMRTYIFLQFFAQSKIFLLITERFIVLQTQKNIHILFLLFPQEKEDG